MAVSMLMPALRLDGALIAQLREAAGWTQVQLSEVARVSQATISRMEKGESVSTTSLWRVASALGVRPDALYHDGEEVEAAVDMAPRPTREPIALRGGSRYPVEVRKMPRIPLLGVAPAAAERYALQGGTIPVPGEALEGVVQPGAVRITGRELEPLGLFDGELAIVDQAVTDWRPGETYLVEVGGRVTFRKANGVEPEPAGARCLGLLCWIMPPLRKPS